MKILRIFCVLWEIWWAKLTFNAMKNWGLWFCGTKFWIYPHKTVKYRRKYIFRVYRYPRVPNRGPKYPKMAPWDQNFWSKFPIKVWEILILYIFHNSKLFWLRPATFNQKQNSLCEILGKKLLDDHPFSLISLKKCFLRHQPYVHGA